MLAASRSPVWTRFPLLGRLERMVVATVGRLSENYIAADGASSDSVQELDPCMNSLAISARRMTSPRGQAQREKSHPGNPTSGMPMGVASPFPLRRVSPRLEQL